MSYLKKNRKSMSWQIFFKQEIVKAYALFYEAEC